MEDTPEIAAARAVVEGLVKLAKLAGYNDKHADAASYYGLAANCLSLVSNGDLSIPIDALNTLRELSRSINGRDTIILSYEEKNKQLRLALSKSQDERKQSANERRQALKKMRLAAAEEIQAVEQEIEEIEENE